MIQYRVLNNDIEGALGLALSHPLYYIISILFKNIPVGDTIHRINLVSPIAASFAIANLFLLMKIWLKKLWPAIIAAASLALSHTFWRHASIPETYNMYLAFFFAELIFLCRYSQTQKASQLYWVAFFNGLAISVHMLAIIPLACYGLFMLYKLLKRQLKIKVLVLFILFWAIGALPYEYLIVQELIRTGDLLATINSALFGRAWQGAVLNSALTFKIVKENILFFGLNFPTPNLILAITGFAFLCFGFKRRDVFERFVIALTILFLVFAFRYTVPDRYAFFLPFYAMVSILMGFGLSRLESKSGYKIICTAATVFLIIPAFVYFFLPGFAQNHYPIFKGKRELPFRNEYKHFLQPWKTKDYSAEQFAAHALGLVEEDAVIFSDGTALYPLVIAQQITGLRNDVLIISGHGSYDNMPDLKSEKLADILNNHEVYVVSIEKGYCPEFLVGREFEKTGVLYHLR